VSLGRVDPSLLTSLCFSQETERKSLDLVKFEQKSAKGGVLTTASRRMVLGWFVVAADFLEPLATSGFRLVLPRAERGFLPLKWRGPRLSQARALVAPQVGSVLGSLCFRRDRFTSEVPFQPSLK